MRMELVKILCNDQYVSAESMLHLMLSVMLFPNDHDEQKSWLTKYVVLKMNYTHANIAYTCAANDEIEAYSKSGFIVAMHAMALGGWFEFSKYLFANVSQPLRELILNQAKIGLISGHILKAALENNGNISKACERVSQKNVGENETYSMCKIKKYDDPEYFRKNYWYKFKNVAHLWAAATDYFHSAAELADIVIHDPHPFYFSINKDIEVAVRTFSEKSRSVLARAINFKTNNGREKPLIDIGKCQFTFDLELT